MSASSSCVDKQSVSMTQLSTQPYFWYVYITGVDAGVDIPYLEGVSIQSHQSHGYMELGP